MISAIFMAGSAAFFTAYVLIADAMGFLGDPETSTITSITVPETPSRGGWNGLIDSVVFGFQFAFDLMGRFFQLISFQAPGQEAAGVITLMIFVPLGFANAFIIFRAIRS